MKSKSFHNIEGIGTDIIEVHRIKKAIDHHGIRFLNKIFTDKEIAYCQCYRDSIPHFAGRFAAKEAVSKALGTGLNSSTTWKEIEILNDPQGKPEVYLSAKLQQMFPTSHLFLSISHCREYATATALLVG